MSIRRRFACVWLLTGELLLSGSTRAFTSVLNIPPRHGSRVQIGSVKGPKNFGSSQTVFHRDDVPAARRERKKEVKEVSTARGRQAAVADDRGLLNSQGGSLSGK